MLSFRDCYCHSAQSSFQLSVVKQNQSHITLANHIDADNSMNQSELKANTCSLHLLKDKIANITNSCKSVVVVLGNKSNPTISEKMSLLYVFLKVIFFYLCVDAVSIYYSSINYLQDPVIHLLGNGETLFY